MLSEQSDSVKLEKQCTEVLETNQYYRARLNYIMDSVSEDMV